MSRSLIPYARPVITPPLRRVRDTWSLDFASGSWCLSNTNWLGFSSNNPGTECAVNKIWSPASKQLHIAAALFNTGGLLRLIVDSDNIADLTTNGLKIVSRANNRLAMPGHTSDPGSLVNGDRWRNSTSRVNKHQRETGTAADPSALYTNTAAGSEISGTAAETNFSLTNSIPANSVVAGSMFLVVNGGKYSTDASVAVTQTFRAKWGSTVLAASAAMSTLNGASNVGWCVAYLLLIVSTGASGTALCWMFIDNNRNHAMGANAGTITIDTTAAATLQESIQMSVSDADNKITPQARAVLQLW